jgi:signal transduction histidine kinase/PAS domain-containing protein/ActR/RegA family two-component response regulator
VKLPGIYSDRRKSGIQLIGELPWGSHFCQFYETQADLVEILLPFFRAGLANNECCVVIASEALNPEEAKKALKKGLRQFDRYLNEGQIEIIPHSRWYAMGDGSGKAVVSILDKAVIKGFDGLRLACHASHRAKANDKYGTHAAADVIGKYNVIGLFAYPRKKYDATGLMEVVNRHRYALVRNAGKWEAMESSEARIVKDALTRSEQKLQLLFHNMSEGFAYHRIVVDGNGKPCDYVFLEANEAFQRLTGLNLKSIVGKRATGVLPGIESDPTDWIGKYGTVALTGNPVQFESYSEQLKRWYSVSAFSPYKGFFAVTFGDITERKRVDEQLRKAHDELDQKVRERTEELRKANSMLRMISECNQVLVHGTEETELIREVCRVLVEMGGYRMAWVGYAEDDEEKTVRPVAFVGFGQEYLKNGRVSWADVPRGRGPTGTCIRTGKVHFGRNFAQDPELAPWRDEALKIGFRSSMALPLMSGGKAFGALNIYSETPDAFGESEVVLRELADDLAFGILNLRARVERDQARAAAEKRAGQLQALAVEFVQAEQNEKRRLARILHDHLQQILVGAKFGASLILAKAKDNEDIAQTAEELIGTIDEAIRASRSLSADLSPPVLHEKGLAAGLKWLGRQMQEKHGFVVELEAEESAEPEAEQIRQFLFESVRELLLNAVKYAQVDRAKVQMRMLKSGEVEITVADRGVGFDPEKVADSASTVSGFGLFSIRERLSYLRGSMMIDAAPGQGSRFTLVAPARLAPVPAETKQAGDGMQAPDERESAPQGNESIAAAGRKISVLLADDHPVLRQGLIKLLEEHSDIQVIGTAGDGRAAVDLALKLKPDVVLMDVSLPLIDGCEATRQILSESPNARVIGLSMHEESEMEAAMLKAGAVAYLTKGGPIEHLITIIRSCRLETYFAGKAQS